MSETKIEQLRNEIDALHRKLQALMDQHADWRHRPANDLQVMREIGHTKKDLQFLQRELSRCIRPPGGSAA